eukprot:TRINITY_DN12507_c0_g1_i1.p1 TRINITY_DN12507_c0_g1~~TRINITY_DN12507_c0_g1_i1.p1  ORF type:complete len:100 (-),score=3.16 TRINITY_DN12507_c0_g1_i1:26-325(-)
MIMIMMIPVKSVENIMSRRTPSYRSRLSSVNLSETIFSNKFCVMQAPRFINISGLRTQAPSRYSEHVYFESFRFRKQKLAGDRGQAQSCNVGVHIGEIG